VRSHVAAATQRCDKSPRCFRHQAAQQALEKESALRAANRSTTNAAAKSSPISRNMVKPERHDYSNMSREKY